MPKKKAKKTSKKKALSKGKAKKKPSRKPKTKSKTIKTIKKPKRGKISRKTIESQIKKAVKNIPKLKQETKRKVDLLDIEHRRSNKLVIFDTNFLVIPEQFKLDIFTQAKRALNARKVDFMVFDKTIYELQKLSIGSSKAAISAKVGLQLINNNNVNVITSHDNTYVDDMLVNYESYIPEFKGEVIVATQDKELKKRLKNKRIKVLIMANKSRLALK